MKILSFTIEKIEINKYINTIFLQTSLLFIFSILLSTSIFINIYSSISELKKDKINCLQNECSEKQQKAIDSKIKISDINDDTERLDALTRCYEENLSDYNEICDEYDENKENTNLENNTSLSENKTEENNHLIKMIYILLVVALNLQISLFLCSFLNKNKLNSFFFDFSEWCINTPPILGVLGTIISFALLMEKARLVEIQKVFTDGFFDAAITTVIGGVFYTINLALKIRINSCIKE